MRRFAAIAVALSIAAAACSAEGDGGASGDVYDGPRTVAAAHPLGLKYDLNRSNAFAPFLKRLAGGTTFFMLVWCDVEPEPGRRDWTEADRAVDVAERLGYRMALHIRVGSCWATGGRVGEARGRRAVTPSAPPRDMAAYRSFVRATVERYNARGVHDYAVENEVNAAAFWRGTPRDYEGLVAAAADEIRRADADARVFDSGLSSTAYGAGIANDLRATGRGSEAVAAYNAYYAHRASTRARDFPVLASTVDLDRALANDQGSRNLEYLAVTERLARADTIDAVQVHFYEGPEAVPALVEYVRRHAPDGMPVEVWELGMYRPGQRRTDQVQADQLARAVVSLLAAGVRRVVYLPTAYDPGGRRETELRWGLLRPDGSVGAPAELYALLAEVTSGATIEPVRSPAVAGVLAARGTETTAVLWSDTGVRLPGPAPSGVTATDSRGASLSWGSDGLTVGGSPVIVTARDVAVLRQLLADASNRA